MAMNLKAVDQNINKEKGNFKKVNKLRQTVRL